jgi:RNA polymerase sigma-70 factor (ECF subfamily)
MSDTYEDPLATDMTLLEAVRNPANHPAWETFMERYRPMVRGWCRCWFPEAPDDSAHEVFCKLLDVMRGFRYQPEKGRFRGWLKTMTHNLMAELKGGGRLVLLDPEVLTDVEAREDLEARLAAEFDLELAELASKAVRARVEANTWSAFVGTAVDGRRPVDVARELDMKVGTVYQAKYAVKEMLKREIEILEGDN